MTRLFLFVLLAVLSVSGRPQSAAAWGYDGHRIVCAMAWDLLKPTERAWVEWILDAKGRDAFAESCLWADEFRRWSPETGPLHYVNVPRGTSRLEPPRDCAAMGCVAMEVLNQAPRIRSTYSRDALRFTAHFVGDMHQPLHMGYADDLGGNLVKGKFMGLDTNLHGLWDYGMLDATRRPWREIADDLGKRITQGDRWAWGGGTPVEWAQATLDIAQSATVGYGSTYTLTTPPFELGQPYLDANLATAYTQMQKAASRLADILANFLQGLPPPPAN